ncbi:DUF1826 domain-containing protein [Sneathiella glossodoripedis]|uniref:DUF1826 domain-containing protein n=1 Tax=Sneathiella glossodoripedis TaxID=418853 RepID=UPI000472A617|nr:DUF1826 domain-containing protein [Sneathiella glossodoripedis]
MSVYQANSLQELEQFSQRTDQLAVLPRDVPENADAFFEKLITTPFGVNAKVHKSTALDDIAKTLAPVLPGEVMADPFYLFWLDDMAAICKTFCVIENSPSIGFWLGTERGCRRFHVDYVPHRLLVTYAGEGTEWLPDDGADRTAFANGAPNEKIVKNPKSLKHMNVWDIAVFRGGAGGLLHRTPDSALNAPSLLLRLDSVSFWERVTLREQSLAG